MMTLSAVHKNRADPCRLISQQRCLDQMWKFKCANRHSYHAVRASRYQNNHKTSGPQSGEPSIFESVYPKTNTHLEFVTRTTRLVESETPNHWPEGLVYPVTLLRQLGKSVAARRNWLLPGVHEFLEKEERCLNRQIF